MWDITSIKQEKPRGRQRESPCTSSVGAGGLGATRARALRYGGPGALEELRAGQK